MSFVADYGGKIAMTRKGKWVGTLDKPAALAGLAAYKRFFDASSRAQKTTDEAHPQPYDVMAQGNAASTYGAGWFTCCVGDYKSKVAQFVMPSHTKGQPIPGFLGGSDLAVPIGANRAAAAAWISAFTDNASMSALRAKGNIPNTTSLLGNSVNERAARKSWFVPTSKNWINVENGNVLRTMLSRILTGKSIDQGRRVGRERQHHVHPESVVGSRGMTVAAEATAHRSRRRPRAKRIAQASVPYLLILPVIVVITAILGYPLYKLATLSFQQYGLAELIQRKGVWIGLDNYSSVLHDEIFWRTLLRTVIFTAANVALTIGIGTLIAFLLVRVSAWVRVLLTAGLVLVWSMPAVVAVQVWFWMTNFQNGILNHVLTRAPRR